MKNSWIFFFNIRQQFPSSLHCHVTTLDVWHMYITHQKVIFPIDQTKKIYFTCFFIISRFVCLCVTAQFFSLAFVNFYMAQALAKYTNTQAYIRADESEVEAWNRKISIFNENISENVLFVLSHCSNMPLQSRG